MTVTDNATLAADYNYLQARGRSEVAIRTTRELCDMYVAAKAVQDISTGLDQRAASQAIGWIVEELEVRDPRATREWVRAEERIERRLLAHDRTEALNNGGSELAPHPFYGCEEKPTR